MADQQPTAIVTFPASNNVSKTSLRSPYTTESLENGAFIVHQPSFKELIGPSPTLEPILTDQSHPFAHEAGVYIPSTGHVFITSNQYRPAHLGGKKHIQISRLWKDSSAGQWRREALDVPGVQMGNGGVNYKNGILFCAQGTFTDPGGLVYMSADAPYPTSVVLNNYHGRWFNSVNDVVVHSDGSIWFTDPSYGFEQNLRPRPQLPCLVYRFDPATGDVRAVADGFGKPNGICFSPDEKTVYITDTNAGHGEGYYLPHEHSSIYAFTVVYDAGSPFLTNRRLFALCDTGIPDGIKCDLDGNVYSGCGDGVQVWNVAATLIGKIYVPGGCANFCFGEAGEVFLLNETKVWRAQLARETKGALLGI